VVCVLFMYCTGYSAVYTVEIKIKEKENGNVVLDWYSGRYQPSSSFGSTGRPSSPMRNSQTSVRPSRAAKWRAVRLLASRTAAATEAAPVPSSSSAATRPAGKHRVRGSSEERVDLMKEDNRVGTYS